MALLLVGALVLGHKDDLEAEPPPEPPSAHAYVDPATKQALSAHYQEPLLAPPLPPLPPRNIEGWATHYGGGPAWGDAINYNGGWLSCRLYNNAAGDNRYYSSDTTIAAIGPFSPWECGDRLRVCGPRGCIEALVQDVCPGCGPRHLDLSEAGHRAVCYAGSCPVAIFDHEWETTSAWSGWTPVPDSVRLGPGAY